MLSSFLSLNLLISVSSPNSLACLRHSHRKQSWLCPVWCELPVGAHRDVSVRIWGRSIPLLVGTVVMAGWWLGPLHTPGKDLPLAGAGFTFWSSAVTRRGTLKICHCYAVELTSSISLLGVLHRSGLPVFNSLAKHKLFWEIISQLSI